MDTHTSAVMWEHASVVCTSRRFGSSRVEIVLTSNGVVIEEQSFSTAKAAADFAIKCMHTYGVLLEHKF
jgi:hypothetical protein